MIKLKKLVTHQRILIAFVTLVIFFTFKFTRQDTTISQFKKSVFQGMIRYDYETPHSGAEKLIYFGLINDHKSYGVGRDFNQVLDLLISQNQNHVSLALLISSKDEFRRVASIIASRHLPQFSRVVLLLHEVSSGVERGHRHHDNAQKQRRRHIALLRNTLMYSTLHNEEYAVWIDADILEITPGTVQKMIASGKDIITPGCQWGKGNGDYDQNAWKGKRVKPTAEELEGIKNGDSFIPRPILSETKYVMQMRADGVDFVELDSVGGTLLFVKAEIFRKGISFPPYYVIGADWDLQEGYDGIETEGICYVAKALGYKCWGMPHDGNFVLSLVTVHQVGHH